MAVAKRLYFLSVGFFFRRRGPASGDDLGGSNTGGGALCEVRSALSQSTLRRVGSRPTGQKAATGSSYADARFVNKIRSSDTGTAASRHMTSITTGFVSSAAAASYAGQRSPSFRCSLCLTRITACWRAGMDCSGVLWSTARGRRHCPSFKTLIGCPIRPRSAAGQLAWTVSSWFFPFSARRSHAWPVGWPADVKPLIKRSYQLG